MRWRWGGARRAERGREDGGAPEGEENTRGSAEKGRGEALEEEEDGTWR